MPAADRSAEPLEPSIRLRRLRRLGPDELMACLEGLCDLLLDCVEGGASISFVWPMRRDKALAFWHKALDGVRRGERALLVAEDASGRIVGTAQLLLAMPENQAHRADVAKVLVLRSARRLGIARRLMAMIDDTARAEGKSVLVLDTVTGSDGDGLYAALGWVRVGVVPRYALMPDGAICDATIFYKHV